MRLIDVDKLKKQFRFGKTCYKDCARDPESCAEVTISLMDMCYFLNNAPTVEVEQMSCKEMSMCEEAFKKGYEKAQKDILKAMEECCKESTNGHML